jgi:FkbM family methyltransferase
MDPIEQVIREHVGVDDVVIDIGANQGLYTKLLASLARHVYAFEPNPRIFPILKQCVTATNATLIQRAASDRVGTIDFFVDLRPGLDGVASSVNVLDGMDDQVERVEVETTTVDELCRSLRIAPSFIKVDVEGHEPAVFRGAWETLLQHRPVLVFEFWESWWTRGFAELFAKLMPYYELHRVQDGVDVAQFYGPNTSDKAVDIVAVPKHAPVSRQPTVRNGSWRRALRSVLRPFTGAESR